MERENAKKLLKFAVFVYIASFLVINWSDVSWIFNYREIGGLISDFFNPYPGISASSIDPYFYPNHSSAASEVKTAQISYTNKQNTLEIPGLSLELPIIFSTTAEKSALMKDLDAGVVYYPGSVYPGQTGQIVILGHSAPPGWPKIKHDWVFTDIDELKTGDKILIDLNNKQYTYIVKSTTIIKKGADVPTGNNPKNSELVLISCWPPGKDYQRIAVRAELLTN